MKKKFAIAPYINGKDIKEFRQSHGLSQAETAQLLGVSKKSVEKWEYEEQKLKGPIVLLMKLLKENPESVEYYHIPKRENFMRLWYMYENTPCTLIDVNDRLQIVEIRNYTKWPQFRAFGNQLNPTYEEYLEFLESRCFPRSRDKMKIQLKELGIPFYDPMMIIEKTEGRMAEDKFWIKLGGDND